MLYLNDWRDNDPTCLASSNWEIIKSLSACEKAILALSKRLLDWITSKVVRVLLESYSWVMPSFAISAAFSCALVASSTLFEDWYLDQILDVCDATSFFVSCKISWKRCLFNVDFLEDIGSSKVSGEKAILELEKLPQDISSSPLIETLKASLRRYMITDNVQNTSDAITVSVNNLALKLDSENTMIRYLIWAIPSLGFVGTVRGIGQALSNADKALAGDISGMSQSLGVAFNSTFVALLISLILMLLLHLLQKIEDNLLINIQSYSEKFLLNRISRT